MNHDEKTLAGVCSSLWGINWQTPLADHLNVDPRTVRRWKSGAFDVPSGVWLELLALINKRTVELLKWHRVLEPPKR